MDEIVKEIQVVSDESLPRPALDSRDPILPGRHDDDGTPAATLLAPITAPATAVAVPASRRYAAVDPQPVAVMAPALSPAVPPDARRFSSVIIHLRKGGGQMHCFESVPESVPRV